MTFVVAAEMYDRFVGRYSDALGRALAEQAERWRRLAGLVDKLLLEN